MKFIYNGPISGVTLQNGTEIILHKSQEVELPEDNDYVKTLIALGYLNQSDNQAYKKTKTDAIKEAENAG